MKRSGGRDPARNRGRILAAALGEFARSGLGGARVDRIAARAGANKRMLYYYFGNKEDLFLAVLESRYAHIRRAELGLQLGAFDPAEGIRRRRSRQVAAMHSPLVAILRDLLERGVREGKFRRGVDPVQLYISIAALGYFYLGNRHTLSTIFERDLLTARNKAERLKHMTDLVLGYLRR